MAFAMLSCRGKTSASAPPSRTAASADWRETIPTKLPAYKYPAPVKGEYHEVNLGTFDVVDGVAFPARSGAATVVYVTSKPIASPVLAGSPCPMTQARSLTLLRNASWLEVALDSAGRSDYFAAGNAFGGSSREHEVGGRYWSSKLRSGDSARAKGNVRHKRNGEFDFDLPLSHPSVVEVSEADWRSARHSIEGTPRPAQEEVTAAYRAVREAALSKDLKGLLEAQGFDGKQVAAIRGLEGIDADVAVYADRFLLPGTPGDFTSKPGIAYVRSEGANSRGKKFANYYHFVPCRAHFVLTMIAENPQ